MRYRYIVSGYACATSKDSISDFHLIAGNRLMKNGCLDIRCATTLRVTIPDDMVLNKYTCDDYSTTNDRRRLCDLQIVPVVRINGRWTKRLDLQNNKINEMDKAFCCDNALHGTTTAGYLDNARYTKYIKTLCATHKKNKEVLMARYDVPEYAIDPIDETAYIITKDNESFVVTV